jgi:hypothetical protein
MFTIQYIEYNLPVDQLLSPSLVTRAGRCVRMVRYQPAYYHILTPTPSSPPRGLTHVVDILTNDYIIHDAFTEIKARIRRYAVPVSPVESSRRRYSGAQGRGSLDVPVLSPGCEDFPRRLYNYCKRYNSFLLSISVAHAGGFYAFYTHMSAPRLSVQYCT